MANAQSKCFYVYLHRRKSDNIVFYVGKGTGRRHNKYQARNPHWQATAKKHGWYSEIVLNGVQEWYALEVEQELIAKYQTKKLCNRTTGGDGMWTSYFTDELKAHLSRVHKAKNKKLPEHHKKRLAQLTKERCMGVPLSEKTKKLISERVKVAMQRPDVRLKYLIGNANRKRKPHKESTKAKMSLVAKGKPKSAEHRANMCRKIQCIETGIIFNSCTLAAEWLQSLGKVKAKSGSFSQGMKKGIKTYGYYWKYVD